MKLKSKNTGLNKVCELTQNHEVLFIEPKKHWWKKS